MCSLEDLETSLPEECALIIQHFSAPFCISVETLNMVGKCCEKNYLHRSNRLLKNLFDRRLKDIYYDDLPCDSLKF